MTMILITEPFTAQVAPSSSVQISFTHLSCLFFREDWVGLPHIML